MKKIIIILVLIYLGNVAGALEFKAINLLNSTNLAIYFSDYLGYLYDSHGCLHFSPSDIYLLTYLIPKGTPLEIKSYNEKQLDFQTEDLPFLAEKATSREDLKRLFEQFKGQELALVVYPAFNRSFLFLNGEPFAQLVTQPGPPKEYLMAQDAQKGGAITYDIELTTPTDPGKYQILRSTSHYVSNAYYLTTVVPFGAWIEKVGGKWAYKTGKQWTAVPDALAADLDKPYGEGTYNYYDVTLDKSGRISAARWAGHDFGKYVLLWTKDGKNYYPEMGYAEGELLYEQILLVKDLSQILTAKGSDEIESLVSGNYNFSNYRDLNTFIESKGQIQPDSLDALACVYYALYSGWELNDEAYDLLDDRLIDAMQAWESQRYPFSRKAKQKMLGLYYFLRQNALLMEKQANWYKKLKADWDFWSKLRSELNDDFEKMGIYSAENRQLVVEKWLNDRLEFKPAALPEQYQKYSQATFSAFFKPDEELMVFTEREREIMLGKLKQAISGEATTLTLYSVAALNNYNLGLLLDQLLGNLYKSHGCLHVSPRNSELLYQLLPLGARITIYDYSKTIDERQLESVPFLTGLVNFEDDLLTLKTSLESASKVSIAVYPLQGYWIIYLSGQPFAKLHILGGPKQKFYMLEARDEKGQPLFEDSLAYPTTPGSFYIFKKVTDYISNLYYDTTVIPQGGLLKLGKDKWQFLNRSGKWTAAPAVIQQDLGQPAGSRAFTYYASRKDKDEKLIETRWGSQPFGKYCILTSRDRIYPTPEIIHSSGDLIMERRQLVQTLIRVLSAPEDTLDECIAISQNGQLYKACYDFIADPTRQDLLGLQETANYKLYLDLPLTSFEAAALYPDAVIAQKVIKKKGDLTSEEAQVLIRNGLAQKWGKELKINQEKLMGINFDTYQYVVAIRKNANTYEVLKNNWSALSELRAALLSDFKRFVIKDPEIFYAFTRELMLKRAELKRLDQPSSLQLLNQLLTSPEVTAE